MDKFPVWMPLTPSVVRPLEGTHVQRPDKTDSKGPSFMEYLKDAFEGVNQAQVDADRKTVGLVTGQVADLHQVMIASEKASIGLQLALQVRNKAVEAYQEIMRMQV